MALLPCCAFADDDKQSARKARGLELFETKIRPVLIVHCYECHSAESDELAGSFALDTRDGLLRGGEIGPAVVPRDPDASLLLSALEYESLEMPPDQKLPAAVIKDFRRWIALGAPDPRRSKSAEQPSSDEESEAGASEPLWSLAPLDSVDPPQVDSDWPSTDIDRFILARQQSAGVEPVADAQPTELLRRVYFDLVGLPPDPQTVRAFLQDPSREHYVEIVDRLLSSPQYGERWARHWLDIVRYGESAGSSRDVLMPYAWRYRDYVIDAITEDIPYHRFVTEQIAGDRLPAGSQQERDRLQVATGLLAIGSKSLNGGNLELDIIDDQIDVIGKAVLGLTVACARCHDHKFDPIPTADYYALAGIFKSTETFYGGGVKRPENDAEKLDVYLTLGGPIDPEKVQQQKKLARQVERLEKESRKTQKTAARLLKQLGDNYQQREKELRAAKKGETALDKKDEAFLRKVDEYREAASQWRKLKAEAEELRAAPKPAYEYAVGVRDAKKPTDAPIQVRGERNNRGDVVPRGFLSCVTTVPTGDDLEIPDDASGRLQLARWLTDPRQPLTPRVAVNRVWQHLFGRGIVESPDNFGVNGGVPTHPQLLDYLAARFVTEHGWSRKALIRELVLSRVYTLSTDFDPENHAVDPENQLRWRMDRRRLEAEPLRDAILAAGGSLELARPAGSAVLAVGEGEVGRGINEKPLTEPKYYRSVYLPIVRGMVPEPLKIFDFPEPSNPQAVRDTSNVPAQSLYLMNSPQVLDQARRLGSEIASMDAPDAARVEEAFLRCLSRLPTEAESSAALQFVEQSGEASADKRKKRDDGLSAWAMLAHSLMASAQFRYID